MALTPSQRQAQRRAKLEQQGKKQLGLGFVDTKYHEPLKQLVAELESGAVLLTNKGEIARPIRDKREENKLTDEVSKRGVEIERLKGELSKAKQAFQTQATNTKQANATIQQRVKDLTECQTENKMLESKLGQFNALLWRFYWR